MTANWTVREYILTHHTEETALQMLAGLKKMGISIMSNVLAYNCKMLGAYPLTKGDIIRKYMMENPTESVASLADRFKIGRSAVFNHRREIKDGTRTKPQGLTPTQEKARQRHKQGEGREALEEDDGPQQVFIRPKAVYSQKSSPLVNEARGIITTH